MTDYEELAKALRGLANGIWKNSEYTWFGGEEKVFADAAAAIEDLQAQLPKRGEWVRKEGELTYWYECSECGYRPHIENYPYLSDFCPNCGAKMEVQDGQE